VLLKIYEAGKKQTPSHRKNYLTAVLKARCKKCKVICREVNTKLSAQTRFHCMLKSISFFGLFCLPKEITKTFNNEHKKNYYFHYYYY